MKSGSPTRRPRVLLLAYACAPDRGSECKVGWHRALESARFCDTWVLTEGYHYGPAIERHLATHPRIPGLTFELVRKTRLERFITRVPGLYYLAYNLWHRRAYRAAERLHARIRFDLVHHVNLVGFREPGYLWKLDAPFVWGPVGGAQNLPRRFLHVIGIVGFVQEAWRSVANQLQLRFSRRFRRAMRAAWTVLAANSITQHHFARVHGVRSRLMLETGLPRVADAVRRRRDPPGPLRILWSGECRPFKGLPLLLTALAQLPADVAFELRVLGNGPALARWEAAARRLGVADRTTWMGWLPHADALEAYAWADVFAFTSLRDTSGNSALEALAEGVPVICLDHHGMRDIVTEDCGVKIPVTTPAEVTDGFGRALRWLARDPAALERLSQGALDRARDYLWSTQGRQMADIYRDVLVAAGRERGLELRPATTNLQVVTGA